MKKILVVVMVLTLATMAAAQKHKTNPASARQVVISQDAPKPIGPYSQAIKAGGLVFVSGQVAFDPATGKVVEGDIKVQTDRVMKNLSAILAAAGTSMDRVVRATIFLKNISDYPAMNETYGKFFTGAPQSRSTIGVANLPRAEALVEIDLIALQ